MTDLERNEIKSLVYHIISKATSNTPSTLANGVTDPFWKTVKIKELPVKESIDKQSVMLIEDNEDTKQMSLSLFFSRLDDLADEALKLVKDKLEAVDSYLEGLGLDDIVNEITKAEEERKRAEEERKQNEKDRENTFNGWKDKIDNVWTPAMEDAIKKEAERQSNEEYRIDKFNEWLELIKQWEINEQQRQDAEKDRETAEDNREQNEQNRQDIFNNKIVEINNAITNMNNTINNKIQEITINIDNKLGEMDDAIDDMNNTINNKIQEITINIDNKLGEMDDALKSVQDAIDDMNSRFDEIMDLINSGMKVVAPVGTTLFATSSSPTLFNTCFGGTWEIVGNIDAMPDGAAAITLYMFRKVSE